MCLHLSISLPFHLAVVALLSELPPAVLLICIFSHALVSFFCLLALQPLVLLLSLFFFYLLSLPLYVDRFFFPLSLYLYLSLFCSASFLITLSLALGICLSLPLSPFCSLSVSLCVSPKSTCLCIHSKCARADCTRP